VHEEKNHGDKAEFTIIAPAWDDHGADAPDAGARELEEVVLMARIPSSTNCFPGALQGYFSRSERDNYQEVKRKQAAGGAAFAGRKRLTEKYGIASEFE